MVKRHESAFQGVAVPIIGRAIKIGTALVVLALLGCLVLGASAAIVQVGNLRVTLLGQIQPYRLPRVGTAPIAVFISGHVGTPDGRTPPQLERMTIKVNRRGRLDDTGLPTCGLADLQPGSTQHALDNCSDALVGSGRFWASIVLPDQRPYPTRGRLLVFNGRRHGHDVIFAHIYTTNPFATSFVITFAIHRIAQGGYGTELSASLPQALGTWGYLDRIKLTLRRKYLYRGRPRSFFNAGCPAPAETSVTAFPLARANFAFADGKRIGIDLTKSCRVKE